MPAQPEFYLYPFYLSLSLSLALFVLSEASCPRLMLHVLQPSCLMSYVSVFSGLNTIRPQSCPLKCCQANGRDCPLPTAHESHRIQERNIRLSAFEFALDGLFTCLHGMREFGQVDYFLPPLTLPIIPV